MAPLVLASASPRRRELLARVGIVIEVAPADVDESLRPGEDAVAYAARLARDKADAVAERLPQRWVLAADTVVEIGKNVLGKAGGDSEARDMLAALSGKTHRVTTAFCLCRAERRIERAVTTDVTFRSLPAAEIDAYVRAGEWRGKAGAYAVQGMAAAMVASVRGSITNVIGLPLAEVVEELAATGAAGVDYPAGEPA